MPIGNGNDNDWFNVGFIMVEPETINYIKGDETIWGKEPSESFANMVNYLLLGILVLGNLWIHLGINLFI